MNHEITYPFMIGHTLATCFPLKSLSLNAQDGTKSFTSLLCFNISFKKTQVPFCSTLCFSLVETKTIQVQDLDWPPAASLLQLPVQLAELVEKLMNSKLAFN